MRRCLAVLMRLVQAGVPFSRQLCLAACTASTALTVCEAVALSLHELAVHAEGSQHRRRYKVLGTARCLAPFTIQGDVAGPDCIGKDVFAWISSTRAFIQNAPEAQQQQHVTQV